MRSTVFSNRALSLQQDITKYQSELRVYENEQAEEELQLTPIRTEIEAITTRVQTRATELATLQGNVDRLSERITFLRSGGHLANGRQRTHFIKMAEKEKAEAEQALQTFIERTAADEDRDSARLKELTAEQHLVEQQLTKIQTSRQMIEQAIQDTRAEIAQSMCEEIIIRVGLLQDQIRGLSHELALVRQILMDTVEEGIASLCHFTDGLAYSRDHGFAAG